MTRTNENTSGHALIDPFAESRRRWSSAEDRELRVLYASGLKVRDVALRMRVDQRQVAIRLIELLLEPEGRIDNDDEKPNAHKSYTSSEVDRIASEFRAGRRLLAIADGVGRSQLGVGWRLLDLGLPRS